MRYLDPLRKLHCLYVDADDTQRSEVAEWLEGMFAEILVAGSVAEALRLAETHEVHALFSEIHLPGSPPPPRGRPRGRGPGRGPARADSGSAGNLYQRLHGHRGFAGGHPGALR